MRRVSKLSATVAVTAALAVAATACGSDDSGSGGGGGGSTGEGPAIAFDVGGRDDGSFNEAAARGADMAEDELGVETYYLTARENETDADREQRLIQLAEAGHDPVIGVGFLYVNAIQTVAEEFPDTTFGLIDAVVEDQDNVFSAVYAEHEVSYLAGVAAALKTETDQVGFIGALDNPLIRKFQVGFEQGVLDTNPDATVDTQFIADDDSGFADVAKAKEQADGMLTRGVDVIFTAAGLSGSGSIEEIAEVEGAWAIGVDSDQYEQAPLADYQDSILTSAVKGVDLSVLELIRSVEEDEPITGVHEYDLSDGGVWLADSGGFIDDIQDEIEAAEQAIIDGEIEVRETP